jgi:acetolactate decarboxylase
MVQISADIPASLKAALEEKAVRNGGGVSSIITAALAHNLEKPIHTVFRISTSGALVAGVYDREVSVQTLLDHGDFGLGTFANLDGEMAVLDGRAYQIKGSDRVSEARSDAGAPFAVVTWFDAGIRCLFWRNTLQLSASTHHPFRECTLN